MLQGALHGQKWCSVPLTICKLGVVLLRALWNLALLPHSKWSLAGVGSCLLPKSCTLPSGCCLLFPPCWSGSVIVLRLGSSCCVLPWRGLDFSTECSGLTLSYRNVSLCVIFKLLQKSLNAATNQKIIVGVMVYLERSILFPNKKRGNTWRAMNFLCCVCMYVIVSGLKKKSS